MRSPPGSSRRVLGLQDGFGARWSLCRLPRWIFVGTFILCDPTRRPQGDSEDPMSIMLEPTSWQRPVVGALLAQPDEQ